MKDESNKVMTEGAWKRAYEQFIFKTTPKWFEWLGWVFMLGALSLLADHTKSPSVQFVYLVSFLLFMLYFINYFYQFEIEHVPLITNKYVTMLVSILCSALLGWGLMTLFFAVSQSLRTSGT